ncbi:MAG: protocatechuate 3,4-dioxygenase subunit alpha [Gemmatimonadaceae bacterium]
MTRLTTLALATPSQTVGPFFHDALLCPGSLCDVLVPPNAEGELIRIEGVVYDGDRSPVPDAMIEIWQADHHGRYAHRVDGGSMPNEPAFTGFGRCGTDAAGMYGFDTVKPGAIAYDAIRSQAPHISVAVFARGVLNHLFTRLYFSGEAGNDVDPVLERVHPERRASLLARRTMRGERTVYVFDIVLQGDGETVFFDFVRIRALESGGAPDDASRRAGGA